MYSDNSGKLQANYCAKKLVETEVIRALQKTEYTLNTVNTYGENLLHISAANGCLDIIKEILRKQKSCQVIDRKNKFGWSPLMLAIRNRDINTVKYLLEKNANINESTYLGMSILGLAAAISKDMFDIVYKKCPSALLDSMNDDITPLCVAAMKNDKDLFFKLIELGFDVSKSNDYTSLMMMQSTVPEIRNLTKHLDVEDYWNDTSDNIPIEDESNDKSHLHFHGSVNENKEKHFPGKMHRVYDKPDHKNKNVTLSHLNVPSLKLDNIETKTDDHNNNIIMHEMRNFLPHKLNLLTKQLVPDIHSLISPTLTCAFDDILPDSPNMYFTQNKQFVNVNSNATHNIKNMKEVRIENDGLISCEKDDRSSNELPLQRLQSIRPPDLNIQHEEEDLNATLEFVPEFSPLRSPNVPPDINDENVFGENTPTPPRYKTPPRGMILNSDEARMFLLLKRYGLSQHLSIFLEQEVDIDLFMTLTNEDLIQIGIKYEGDRKAILSAITDYKRSVT